MRGSERVGEGGRERGCERERGSEGARERGHVILSMAFSACRAARWFQPTLPLRRNRGGGREGGRDLVKHLALALEPIVDAVVLCLVRFADRWCKRATLYTTVKGRFWP